MLLHVDAVKYKCKPTKAEIGGIKKRFTKSASIKDLTVRQIADCLTAGRTIQPGVTPFSAKSSAKGYKGTNADDFSLQTIFMDDVDNENEDASKETPEHVAAVLVCRSYPLTYTLLPSLQGVLAGEDVRYLHTLITANTHYPG